MLSRATDKRMRSSMKSVNLDYLCDILWVHLKSTQSLNQMGCYVGKGTSLVNKGISVAAMLVTCLS